MIADGYEAFLFDLDGVLYRGADPVPGAAESRARLRALGKGIAFVTNNSGRTPERVAERLRAVGVDADAGEVETSALTTAAVLAGRGVRRAFVVGEVGIVEALTDAGVEVVAGEPDVVDAVVVGWDRDADYTKLRVASVLVQRGAPLVATNPDASFPAADGTKWPGAGALLATIETTTGVRGEVIGKPYPPLLLAALERAGGGRPLLVGDRLDTDIAGAAGLGWDSLLVLTGITGARDLEGSQVRPTYVADDLRGLFADGP
ncbi:MAG: HAD-IIA family hydrolase [Actinomycetota bacterium]